MSTQNTPQRPSRADRVEAARRERRARAILGPTEDLVPPHYPEGSDEVSFNGPEDDE